ncbi:MAG: radical SAM protein [Candidatus Nanoarchaeia archaeon]
MVNQTTVHSIGKKTLDYELCTTCRHGACSMCYLKSFKRAGKALQKNTDTIVKELNLFNDQGYSTFLITSDILEHEDFIKIIKAARKQHVLTTGITIDRNPEILDELKDNGITMIYLSANLEKESRILQLPPYELVRRVAGLTREKGLDVMLTMIITSTNYNKVEDMAELAQATGANNLRFLPYIPYNNPQLSPSSQQLKEFLESSYKFQKSGKYRKDELYFSREIAHPSHKKSPFCNCGGERFVLGADNLIYPCLPFIAPEFVIGKFDNGKLEFNKDYSSPSLSQLCRGYEHYMKQWGRLA